LSLEVPRLDHIPPPARPATLTAQEAATRRAQRVIDAYAPAAVLVDEHYEILHFSGRTGRYLQPSPGAASLNLFNIVDPNLRPDLRAAIGRAMSTGKKVVRENLRLAANDGMLVVNIVAEPLPTAEGEQRLCVVVFQETAPARAEPQRHQKRPETEKDEIVQHLEAELVSTRERL